MTSKTFAGRVEASRLAFADALTRQEYGLSFGQYCSSILIDAIEDAGMLPQLDAAKTVHSKQRAASFITEFHRTATHPEVGLLDDEHVRDLMASRYE